MTEKKYIDASELNVEITSTMYGDIDSQRNIVICEILDIIRNQPAADVVAVVRCKDCMYYLGLAVCKLMGTCGETAFCSKGEKIDGGNK